ncbi:hypothetical protein VU06_00355, partial [Desulfobulbus sp. F3]|nr:hypothetical protein [Desulfobulbus sp. F3]
MSNILLVNEQNVKLEKSGGVGRYGKQLYLYLNDTEEIINANVCFLNHNSIVEENTKNISIFNKSGSFIFFYNCLSRVFHRKANKKSKYPFKYENIHEADTVLLHEITSYSTIDEIGRFCLSKNFFLLVTFLDIQDFF